MEKWQIVLFSWKLFQSQSSNDSEMLRFRGIT
jgi:hypothetical protein